MPEENQLKRLGTDRFPLLRWWRSWADANSVWEAMTTGEPYPVVMAMNSSGDFMCQGNTAYNWEALSKLDFIFEANLWQPPSAGMADILVPAQHWLEIPGCPERPRARREPWAPTSTASSLSASPCSIR